MDCDVLILGAGIAGLRAADLLSAAGLRVVVLEARDRLGGRIHTVIDPALHTAVDLGAEFIHGRPPQTFRLLKEARLIAYDVDDNHHFLRGHALGKNFQFWQQIQRVMKRLPEPGGVDLSFDEFLARQRNFSRATVRSARDFVRGFDAADTSVIGISGLAAAERRSDKIEGDLLFRPVGGYQPLIRYLARNLELRGGTIRLGTIVRQIEWSPEGCRISADSHGRRGSFTSRKVLVTLPVGVLKSGAVLFSPSVPHLSESLAGLAMGPVMKIIFRFRKSFWEERDLSDLNFLHAPGQPFPTWWSQLPLRLPLLTGWAGGTRAAAMADFNAQQITDAAVQTLARCFACSRNWIIRQIDSHYLANWSIDPFSLGAYSYVVKGGLTGARRFNKLGENILFFAGEHTEPELIGTVAAGLASAERIAPRVAAASLKRGK